MILLRFARNVSSMKVSKPGRLTEMSKRKTNKKEFLKLKSLKSNSNWNKLNRVNSIKINNCLRILLNS